MQTIIEYLRERAVSNLFSMSIMNRCWEESWQAAIERKINPRNATNIFNLGDHLSEVFRTTRNGGGRGQGELSGGGSAWEGLVCWYLNLCLIGRRTVVIKSNKELLADPLKDALTVNYQNFPSNTESDLIAITFPDGDDFYGCDKNNICIRDSTDRLVPITVGRRYNLKGILNELARTHFGDYGIHVIQCKTNWNDNAQIPMLWDMIYSADGFRNAHISVGRNGYSMHNLQRFDEHYSYFKID